MDFESKQSRTDVDMNYLFEFSRLPENIQRKILSFVCTRNQDVNNIALVCKKFHGLTHTEELWRNVSDRCEFTGRNTETVLTWGHRRFGILGNDDNSLEAVPSPTEIDFFRGSKVKKIGCGGFYSSVLLENGSLYVTGDNTFCQHGIAGLGTDDFKTTKLIFSSENDESENGGFESVINGYAYVIGIKKGTKRIFHSDGTVRSKATASMWGWGTGHFGTILDHQYCDASPSRKMFEEDSDLDFDFDTDTEIDTDTENSSARKHSNFSNRLSNLRMSTRVGLDDDVDMEMGINVNESCDEKEDVMHHNVHTHRSSHRLPQTSSPSLSLYVNISLFTIAKVSCGDAMVVALSTDRHVFSWGLNAAGRLGNGKVDSEDRLPPSIIRKLEGRNIVQVSCGGSHVIVRSENGRVYTWGSGGVGATPSATLTVTGGPARLGHGNPLEHDENATANFTSSSIPFLRDTHGMPYLNVPVRVHSVEEEVRSVCAGQWHSFVLLQDGRVMVFGGNSFGQLGIGHTRTIFTPTVSPFLSFLNAYKLRGGRLHSGALTHDGRVFTWGCGLDGQLGNGKMTSSAVPVLAHIPEKFFATKLAIGKFQTLVSVRLRTEKDYALSWKYTRNPVLCASFGNNRRHIQPPMIQTAQNEFAHQYITPQQIGVAIANETQMNGERSQAVPTRHHSLFVHSSQQQTQTQTQFAQVTQTSTVSTTLPQALSQPPSPLRTQNYPSQESDQIPTISHPQTQSYPTSQLHSHATAYSHSPTPPPHPISPRMLYLSSTAADDSNIIGDRHSPNRGKRASIHIDENVDQTFRSRTRDQTLSLTGGETFSDFILGVNNLTEQNVLMPTKRKSKRSYSSNCEAESQSLKRKGFFSRFFLKHKRKKQTEMSPELPPKTDIHCHSPNFSLEASTSGSVSSSSPPSQLLSPTEIRIANRRSRQQTNRTSPQQLDENPEKETPPPPPPCL